MGRIVLGGILLLILSVTPGHSADISDSVVKIFVTSNKVDYYRPWQSQGVSSSSGSGAIIQGNKILTNAHVIADYTFIQVKKNNSPKKYTAKVEAIGHDCDLALLSVEDPDFFTNTTALDLGFLPKMQDSVTVLGYPQGGDKLSITEGVVSRVELTSYSQTGRSLLTVQIDAAINPGNSGGPVLQEGKLVGIAMQVFQSGQNIGYMIPTPIISHFFSDLKDDHYDGFPLLGVDYDTTENDALKKLYNIDDNEGGIVITRVLPHSPADQFIQEGDVILSIDGIPLGEDGTIIFRDNERLAMPYLVSMKQIGEAMHMQIIRQGKREEIDVHLTQFKPLVPYPYFFERPPYYIYGGLVFTVLSADLLRAWGNQWWEKAPLDFAYYFIGAGRMNKNRNKDVVVLLNVLPDQLNIGYHNHGNQVISQVNGRSFESFKDFVLLLHDIKENEPFSIFQTDKSVKIILKNEKVDEVTQEILTRNNIPYQYSDEVALWLSAPHAVAMQPVEEIQKFSE